MLTVEEIEKILRYYLYVAGKEGCSVRVGGLNETAQAIYEAQKSEGSPRILTEEQIARLNDAAKASRTTGSSACLLNVCDALERERLEQLDPEFISELNKWRY